MIALFTDFGSNDIYVGQMHAAIRRIDPDAPIVDLCHDVPRFNVRCSAYLLAALLHTLPKDSIVCAVIDPGVGGTRLPIMMRADGRWLVGPDNGLFSIAAAQAGQWSAEEILYRPKELSTTFHGRDLFAPVAAMLSAGLPVESRELSQLAGDDWPVDLGEVIYIDHYGNLFSGIRADNIPRESLIRVRGKKIPNAEYFSQLEPGELFWYKNSIGLLEVASNKGNASILLGASIGDAMVSIPGR